MGISSVDVEETVASFYCVMSCACTRSFMASYSEIIYTSEV